VNQRVLAVLLKLLTSWKKLALTVSSDTEHLYSARQQNKKRKYIN